VNRNEPTGQPVREIEFADQDAEDLLDFFAKINEKSRNSAQLVDAIQSTLITRNEATTRRIREALDDLQQRADSRLLEPGDTVLMIIESQLLSFDGREKAFLAFDTDARSAPELTVPAAKVADTLGQLREKVGCTVMLFVDGMHEGFADQRIQALNDWVAGLYSSRSVITFLASKDGPSRSWPEGGHRVFAQSILDSPLERTNNPNLRGDGPISLADFKSVVEKRVQQLSGKGQYAHCYIPEDFPPQMPIFAPRENGSRVLVENRP
jgi:hypothetical protein